MRAIGTTGPLFYRMEANPKGKHFSMVRLDVNTLQLTTLGFASTR